MAYVDTLEDPQNQNQVPGNDGTADMPSTSATGSGGAATGAGSPQGVSAVPTSTKAPPVQDLKAYLAANAPQSVQMGQNIAGNLDNQYQKASGDVNAAQQGFNTSLQGQTVNPNSDLVSRAASNPAEFVKNDQDLAEFKKQRDAAYTGPQNFEATPEYTQANASVQSAVSKAPDINQPGGIRQLVTGIEKNPTQGMANLDTLLLQENPNAVSPIRGSVDQFKNLNPHLADATKAANASIQQTIAGNNAAKQGVQDTFLTGSNAVVPKWQSSLQQALADATGKYTNAGNDFNDITTAVNSNDLSKLTPQQLTALGLTPDQVSKFQNLYNQNKSIYGTAGVPNASTFYKQGSLPTSAPTLGTTATAEDYARDAALEKLLEGGYNASFLDNSKSGMAGQAGSPTSPNFDIGKAIQTIGSTFQNNDINSVGNVSYPYVPKENMIESLKNTPKETAQGILNAINQHGAGFFGFSPEYVEAVNRLASNSYI